MKKMSLVLLGILFTLSSYVNAGNRPGALSLTLGGGYDHFSSERRIDNTGFPFAAMGYQFTPHWGIEILAGGFTTPSHNPEDNRRQVKGTFAAIDALYHFSPYHLIEPFVLAGAGVTNLNPNGSDANNEGNVNAGIGMQLFLEKSVALRVEARDFYTTVAGKNDVLVDAGVTFLLDLC